ncbi:hypothetical protein RV14_GL002244 [Enterococcus ratti]|uniref:Uncharacterized protein n=1 Tax=Enterococcus ratti TaxID=150033 RepID=A0A1L8WNS8_9ENTE|nr:hypothetical protein RV14_GL002244 [Enterococcus ratti]
MAIIFFLIISMSAASFGYTIGQKSRQQNKKVMKSKDSFTKQQINEFLKAFYTFENYGDNFSSYELFLSKKMKHTEKKACYKRSLFPNYLSILYLLKVRIIFISLISNKLKLFVR